MKILYDFISLQDFVGGGSEYTLCILQKLLDKSIDKNIDFFGLYNSRLAIPAFLEKIISRYRIQLVDINSELENIIEQKRIDVLYIGIAQNFYTYNLQNILCKIIITCHDISEMTLLYDRNFTSFERRRYEPIKNRKIQWLKEFIKYFIHFFQEKKYLRSIQLKHKNLEKLLQRENVKVITVSEFSKYSLLYHFKNVANPITVLSPPHKIIKADNQEIENQELREIIKTKKKYFLLVSCARFHKNAALFVNQWEKFCESTGDEYFGVLVGNISVNKKNLIQLSFLSTTDLEQAYKNAFAFVYPTVAEGYGYPPMEAMKYGIPCVCSNVTSIPEIYSDSVIYFSPYYPEDLFKALHKVIKNRKLYSDRSLTKYEELSEKQENDIESLLKLICEK